MAVPLQIPGSRRGPGLIRACGRALPALYHFMIAVVDSTMARPRSENAPYGMRPRKQAKRS
jgi:hypothetical protein